MRIQGAAWEARAKGGHTIRCVPLFSARRRPLGPLPNPHKPCGMGQAGTRRTRHYPYDGLYPVGFDRLNRVVKNRLTACCGMTSIKDLTHAELLQRSHPKPCPQGKKPTPAPYLRRTIAVPGPLHVRISPRNPNMKRPWYGDGTAKVWSWSG